MKYVHNRIVLTLLFILIGAGSLLAGQSEWKLREQPLKALSEDSVKAMLVKKLFFHSILNPKAPGLPNQFQADASGLVVTDLATGLMWQQSGSPGATPFTGADAYIKKLNKEQFGGYSDWRLPTLEEAMSLMENKKAGPTYLDPVFHSLQGKIWTSDFNTAKVRVYYQPWRVNFSGGVCYGSYDRYDTTAYVKAVRSVGAE